MSTADIILNEKFNMNKDAFEKMLNNFILRVLNFIHRMRIKLRDSMAKDMKPQMDDIVDIANNPKKAYDIKGDGKGTKYLNKLKKTCMQKIQKNNDMVFKLERNIADWEKKIFHLNAVSLMSTEEERLAKLFYQRKVYFAKAKIKQVKETTNEIKTVIGDIEKAIRSNIITLNTKSEPVKSKPVIKRLEYKSA
jgi:hypothetical protein